MKHLFLLLFFVTGLVQAQYLDMLTPKPDPYRENRYCGPPPRDPVTGTIMRDWKVTYAYRKVHKCPSTGFFTGACPNYSLNHVKPLACGGCDAVWNLTWMRNDVKKLHDGYERKIFSLDPAIEDTAACEFQISP